jgi:hypothetical protein
MSDNPGTPAPFAARARSAATLTAMLNLAITVNTYAADAQPSSSQVLNRDTVAVLLLKGKYLPNDYTQSIASGDSVNLKNVLGALERQDPNEARTISRTYECLQSLGYITLSRARGPSGPLGAVEVVVTEKGATIGTARSSKGTEWSGISASAYEFKIATRTLGAVTGIRQIDATTARAQFEWEKSDPNDVSLCIYVSDPDGKKPKGKAHAVLAKYDDGWRIESFGYGD